jgi:TRAP-type C4-dicarboxylate transport system permease small subunit
VKLVTRVTAVWDKVMSVFAWSSACLLAFVCLAVCIDVVLRLFVNESLQWVNEISEYSLVYVTFLGAAWLLKSEGHAMFTAINVRNIAIKQTYSWRKWFILLLHLGKIKLKKSRFQLFFLFLL